MRIFLSTKKLMFAFWLSFFLLFGSGWPASPLIAGAWTPSQGGLYFKLSASSFRSSANFNADGDRIDLFADLPGQFSKFRDEGIFAYFEYGLTNRLALYGSLTYKQIEQRTKTAVIDVSIENDGFADVDLGLRYRLTEGPNIWSIAFLAKLPYLYDDDDFFALGNGQEDFEARVLYGRSLNHGFYAGLEGGYRLRLEDPSDEYRYLGEFGWSGGGLYARTKLDGIKAVDSFADQASVAINPLLAQQFDLDKLELTLGWKLSTRWHLEYTFMDTLSGKNTADGTNHQMSVVFSR